MSATSVLLAPGASGTVERLRPHASRLEARGFEVELVTLPRSAAERAVPSYRAALESRDALSTVIGGHSFGGRVASLLVAEKPTAALVLLSYPLHAPGRTETWASRTAHWPSITCPVLLLSGESDPFARSDLLREAIRRIPDATLVTYPRLGHGLGPVLDEAMEAVAEFVHRRT